MKVKIYNNIVCLTFATQKELTFTMCRPQEYYECNSSKLRGKVFTFEKLVDHYTSDSGYIDYFNYWSGFNLPGHVLEEFFSKFDLNEYEQKLRKITFDLKDSLYYVIATKKEDQATLEHELVHAYYYLNPIYKQEANTLVKHMRSDLRKQMTISLKEMGYASKVIIDEINAYMSTSGIKYLKNELGLNIERGDIKPFVMTAKRILRGSYSGNTLAFQAKARSSILLPRSKQKQGNILC